MAHAGDVRRAASGRGPHLTAAGPPVPSACLLSSPRQGWGRQQCPSSRAGPARGARRGWRVRVGLRGRHPGRPLGSASHNPRRCAEGRARSRPAHGFQHRQLSAVPLPRLPLQASHWITSPSLFLSSVTCSNDLEHVQVFFETPIRLHLGKSLELGDVLPSGCLASGRWGRGQRTGLGTQDRARACLREPAQSRIPAELPRNSNWVPGNSRLSVILG